jgi:Tfp pilus assembly protein PilO
MTKNRLHLVIALAIGAVVLVGGFFLGVQPQLASAASNREQQQSIDSTNDTYRAELARLAAQSAKLPAMRREAAVLERSVPSSADTSAFYKEVNGVAASTGVTVSGITTSWAAAYTPPVAETPVTSPSATATPSPTAAGTPSTPAVTAPVTNAQITASNFSTIAISIDVTGSFEQALAFTSGVQNGERLFLVNDIKSTRAETTDGSAADASTGSGATTWTLSGFIYVLSDAASAQSSQKSESGSGAAVDASSTTASKG